MTQEQFRLTWRIRNGKTGEEVHRMERAALATGKRPDIRTQRTKLQSTLLSHVKPGVIHLSKRLSALFDRGADGVELHFEDGAVTQADLVVGADGIRSVGPGKGTQNLDS
jgi:salicylate hydroxylase